MGIFSDIRDNVIVSNLRRKSNNYFNLNDLAKLSDSQLRKIFLNGDIHVINIGNLNYELTLKLIKLLEYSKEDCEKVSVLLRLNNFKDPSILFQVLQNSDIDKIKNNLYQKYLDSFLSGEIAMNLSLLDEEFINNNKEKLLIGVVPDNIREAIYGKVLTDKIIFDNIDLFCNLEFFNNYDISNFIVSYDFKLLISKIGWDNFNKILKTNSEDFFEKYNNYSSRENMLRILKKESNDYFKAITNYIYELPYSRYFFKGFDSDKKIEIIELLGKQNIIDFCNKTFKQDNLTEVLDRIPFQSSFFKSQLEQYQSLNYEIVEKLLNTSLQHYYSSSKIKNLLTSEAISKNQICFLPDDAPENLKEKFYLHQLTYNDVLNNINYFENTNISLGFMFALRGVLDNECFLKLLNIFSGDINSINFFNLMLRDKYTNVDSVSFETLLKEIEIYFSSNKMNKEYIYYLKKVGFKLDYLEMIEKNINSSNFMQESLYAADMRIFTDNIVNRFGYDIIRTICEFHKSGAMELFIQYANNSEDCERLQNWLSYLSKNNVLNKNIIIHSILSYDKCKVLIDNLLQENANLDSNQINNLISILRNKNKFQVSNLLEMSNYINYKKMYLKEKFESDNLDDVKDSIANTLFELDHIFSLDLFWYGLEKIEFMKYNFIDTGMIDSNVLAVIEIIREIRQFDGDPEQLRSRFEEIMKLGNICSADYIYSKLNEMYNKLWSSQMFRYDAKKMPNIKTRTEKGVDSATCTKDVRGKNISSSDDIEVVELDGEPFKLIVHAFQSGHTPDRTFADIAEKLEKDPSVWNRLDGSTTLSTSLITDKHIALFGTMIRSTGVVYGFNDFPNDMITHVVPRDAGTAHGGGIFIDNGKHSYMSPDQLINVSNYQGYNEVVFRRKSIKEKNEFDGKIQPNCIVCFDGVINKESKLAAQYFRVPIYMIARQKYQFQEAEKQRNYNLGNIDKWENKDIDDILLSPIASVGYNDYPGKDSNERDNYNLCLNLTNKAYEQGLITYDEYIERLSYIYDVTLKKGLRISFESQKYLDEIKNKITELKNNQMEESNNGLSR